MRVPTLVKITSYLTVLMVFVIAFFFYIYRPWQLTWGATEEEVNRPMVGDDIVADPTFNATRAVTIHATPEEIWPWILQIGYKRAGFYSYDRLDNDGIPSAERILPEYQGLQIGDRIPMSASVDAEVIALEPNQHMLMVFPWETTATWAWGLYPMDSEHTRLITRLHARHDRLPSRLLLDAFEIIMMRKCMLGIKRRAERLAGRDR